MNISIDTDLMKPGTCIRVQRFDNDYSEHEQQLVDSYATVEDDENGEPYFVLFQIFKHIEPEVKIVEVETGLRSAANVQNQKAVQKESRQSVTYRAMRDFILSHKDVRKNMVSKAVEWAEKGSNDFKVIDKQELATIWTRLKEADIHIDMNFLQHFCQADIFPHYDPIAEYMDNLPEWDGHDHVADFIHRLTDDEHCVEGMRIWLRAITAKMIHYNSDSPWANMLMPMLVGAQGLRKTTFARRILPVDGFFAQNIDFSPKGDWMRKLCSYVLVCDDEFDRHNDSQLATIKGAISTSEVMMRDPYAKRETSHVRLAAMIGTSNRLDLLRDETGNRRFLVINIEQNIDLETPIPYEQIYAQLKKELLEGQPYYPDADFERKNEIHNQPYRSANIVEDVFFQHFLFARSGTNGSQWLSTAEIYEQLCAQHPMLKREKTNGTQFGRALKPIAQHYATENRLKLTDFNTRRNGLNCYCVVKC